MHHWVGKVLTQQSATAREGSPPLILRMHPERKYTFLPTSVMVGKKWLLWFARTVEERLTPTKKWLVMGEYEKLKKNM